MTRPSHEIDVGIRAMVQKRARDREGVLGHRRQQQTREAQIGQRLPSLRAPLFLGQIAFASDPCSPCAGLAIRARRPTGIVGKRAIHSVDIPQTTAV